MNKWRRSLIRVFLFHALVSGMLASWAAFAEASPSTAQDSQSQIHVIEYYGDSTVWGYASGSDGKRVTKPAPAVFASVLPMQFKVVNEGVNGSTACDLLNGTDGKHPPWRAQMAASKARYVIVNHAINDQWRYDVGAYKTCLWSLARIAQQAGKQMIFETPNPTRDSGGGGLDVYVNAMREVALLAQAPLIDQYRYLIDYLQGRGYEVICPDGLHPTEEVYGLKGRYAAGVFTELMKSK